MPVRLAPKDLPQALVSHKMLSVMLASIGRFLTPFGMTRLGAKHANRGHFALVPV